MKRVTVISLLALAALGAAPASAELFRPETVKGALIGGVAGAVIGHNDGRRGWEGAGYGMAAGAIVGSIVGDARDHAYHSGRYPAAPVYHRRDRWSPSGRWTVGIGYSHGYSRHHDRWDRRYRGWSSPPWAWHSGWYGGDPWRRSYRNGVYLQYSEPVRAYRYPSYAARGAFWGGLAGAVIGHNHGRHGWEGAGYGIAGGYLLGSLADARARQLAAERQAAAAWEQSWSAPAPAPAPAPTQVTINNYYNAPAPASAMASANQAFGR